VWDVVDVGKCPNKFSNKIDLTLIYAINFVLVLLLNININIATTYSEEKEI
jgi:hypothetical protein